MRTGGTNFSYKLWPIRRLNSCLDNNRCSLIHHNWHLIVTVRLQMLCLDNNGLSHASVVHCVADMDAAWVADMVVALLDSRHSWAILVHNILMHSHTAIMHIVSICRLVWHRIMLHGTSHLDKLLVACGLFTVWAVCWPLLRRHITMSHYAATDAKYYSKHYSNDGTSIIRLAMIVIYFMNGCTSWYIRSTRIDFCNLTSVNNIFALWYVKVVRYTLSRPLL